MFQLNYDGTHANIMVQALDLYARIGTGQFEQIIDVLRFNWDTRIYNKSFQLEVSAKVIETIKVLLFKNKACSIDDLEVPDRYRLACRMKKVIEEGKLDMPPAYQVVLGHEEAKILCDALKLYANIGTGSFEKILDTDLWYNDHRLVTNCDEFEVSLKLLIAVKGILFRNPRYHIYSINDKTVPYLYRIAWDTFLVIYSHCFKPNTEGMDNVQRRLVEIFFAPVESSVKDQPLATIKTIGTHSL